jgi:hypothetical protein
MVGVAVPAPDLLLTSEDLALSCDYRSGLVRESPPVFVPVVTQIVTQPLIPCQVTRTRLLTFKGQYTDLAGEEWDYPLLGPHNAKPR